MKVIKDIIVMIIIICVLGIINCHNSNVYKVSAIAINEHEIITNDGNIWGVDDKLTVNNKYIVKFKKNNIENIYDDEIIDISIA